MKKTLLYLTFCLTISNIYSQWQPAGDKIRTEWAEKIDINQVLPEYPRPQMKRTDWQNMNGLWEYAITDLGDREPASFDGNILVPFAVESSLSGVQKTVGIDHELWYRRFFTVPSTWKNRNIILHFGAVDWKSEIWINDIKVGSHEGGYTPFWLDITPFLNKSGEQKLMVKVWDPSEKGYQPHGKQTSRPGGITYTAVTGIWQTVWMEPVASKHIIYLRSIPDIDNSRVSFSLDVAETGSTDLYEVVVMEGDRRIASAKAAINQKLDIAIQDPKLWSPDSPYLYDIQVKLISNGKVCDQVESYFAMRKVSTKRDESGIIRLQLNNKDLFQFGPLDQGWWPDGLYTAPSDDALKQDIVKTKELGFNMIRKHVKVEPARWYTHCDQVGMLVWQDMPNGDRSPGWQNRKYYDGTDLKRTPVSESNYRAEWKAIIDLLYSNPSVVCWVPFNEAWGQFKTAEIVEWTKAYDPGRLVNPASGGNHYPVGDLLDLHNYPEPQMYLYDFERANVLGEYGGIGLAVEGHLWKTDKNWGYVQFKNSQEVTDEYVKFGEMLLKLINNGFSAAVYTQTTDVEGEVNGLMTYDRKVMKMDEKRVYEINRKIVSSLNPE